MKRLKWRLIKFYSLFILMLLAILVFLPSCEKETIHRPTAKFIIKGTVISDEDQKPLKDIAVIMLADTVIIDSIITNLNGEYKLTDSLGIPAEVAYKIRFTELDDTLKSSNELIDSTIIYNFTNIKFSNGDGHWYSGEITKEFNVSLEPKKKEGN